MFGRIGLCDRHFQRFETRSYSRCPFVTQFLSSQAPSSHAKALAWTTECILRESILGQLALPMLHSIIALHRMTSHEFEDTSCCNNSAGSNAAATAASVNAVRRRRFRVARQMVFKLLPIVDGFVQAMVHHLCACFGARLACADDCVHVRMPFSILFQHVPLRWEPLLRWLLMKLQPQPSSRTQVEIHSLILFRVCFVYFVYFVCV